MAIGVTTLTETLRIIVEHHPGAVQVLVEEVQANVAHLRRVLRGVMVLVLVWAELAPQIPLLAEM